MTGYRCHTCPSAKNCRPTPCGSIILENLPLWITYLLGAAIFFLLWWPLAVMYLEICILSIILHMALICPYCYHYGTNTCPSGYGTVSTRWFSPRRGVDFRTQFKRWIWIVFPGWFLPPLAAGYLLVQDLGDIPVWVLLVLFCITGFVILPVVSKHYGCRKCKNKKNCPWGPDRG